MSKSMASAGATTWTPTIKPTWTGCSSRGLSKTKTDAKDIVTNELLDDAINFDEKALIEEAKAYKPK